MHLAVPAADQRVGCRHVREREQPCGVAGPAEVARGDSPQRAVPLRGYVATVEIREVRLPGAARRARERTVVLDLAVIPRVALAGQGRRRLGAKAARAGE